MGSKLILRARTKNGVIRIDTLNLNDSLNELRDELGKLTQIPSENLKILKGYPPQQLKFDGCSLNTTLDSIGLKNGEMLICEEESKDSKSIKNQESVNSITNPFSTSSLFLINKQQQQTVKPFAIMKKDDQLMRKIVPADNSCLFTSVHFAMTNGQFDLSVAKKMRDLIAKCVKENPVFFNEALLGKKNHDYCDWIRNPNSWGGSIECMILSTHYECEICVFDIRTGLVNRFGEDCPHYMQRVCIIYDGIHFDPLYMQSYNSNGQEASIETKFPKKNEAILEKGLELAKEAKSKRQFTDTANFKLRCLACQQPLEGEKQATEHAKKTGHINFGEF
jgi:ubiquitin thioesterase OTU1